MDQQYKQHTMQPAYVHRPALLMLISQAKYSDDISPIAKTQIQEKAHQRRFWLVK